MNTSINGMNYPDNIITFTNCPTILSVNDTWTGTKQSFKISIQSLSNITNADDMYIDINGYKIRGTSDFSKSVGNRFYITSSDTLDNRVLVARTICNALNSIGALTSQYNIRQTTDGNTFNAVIDITAKDVGITDGTIESNINSSNIRLSKVNGSITSTFSGKTTNKVCVDIYVKTDNTDRINGTENTLGEYVATLEKNVFGADTSFDLSPIFNTYASNNKIVQYQVIIYTIVDSKITIVRSYYYIYAVPGYLVNQGGTYLPKFNGCILAQNVSRGKGQGKLNNSLLYVYYPNIVFSMYADSTISSLSVGINYINGAMETFATGNQVIFAGNNLNTFTINLNQVNLQNSSYVDITVPVLGTLRYNVIKPVHATDEQQRIYWNNSYGGTSFFDFTGTRTEERKTDIETYQRSTFDYYKENRAELDMIYSKDVTITVTLTTHNIARDGIWQLFDLQNSYNAWTTVNNKEYSIHISDIKVEETDVNGIYTAEIEYTYSMGDTL